MLIGLTYDLRADHEGQGLPEELLAELDSPETIDALDQALTSLGHAVERIGHIRALATRLVAGARWDLVLNIAEGLFGRSREAQIPALLEAWGQPYTGSDALTQAVGLDKAMAKRIVRDAGLPTAPFCVLSPDMPVCDGAIRYPAFVKPIAGGTGQGCERASRVVNRAELMAAAQRLWLRFDQPALAETYLPGREVTVGILGTGRAAQVLGVMDIDLSAAAGGDVYSWETKRLDDCPARYRLIDDDFATAAADIAWQAHQVLGCRDVSRIDIRADAAGRPMFLEVNTLPGLHPTHSDLPIMAGLAGLTYRQLIGRLVQSALDRTPGLSGRQAA